MALVVRNWLLGRRIAEEELGGDTRLELYGRKVVPMLAKELTATYGKGYTRTSLYQYVQFYRMFPEIPFAAVLGGRPGVPLKPDPSIVAEIRSRAGVSLRETVMVGDSATDIATAAGAEVDCVAVSWGFRTREQLGDAPRIVDTAQELRAILFGE